MSDNIEDYILDYLPDDSDPSSILKEGEIPEGMIWLKRQEISQELKYELEALKINGVDAKVEIFKDNFPGKMVMFKLDIYVMEEDEEKARDIIMHLFKDSSTYIQPKRSDNEDRAVSSLLLCIGAFIGFFVITTILFFVFSFIDALL